MVKKNKQKEMPIGTKQVLMKRIDTDNYDAAVYAEDKKNKLTTYWTDVAKVAYMLHLHSNAKKGGKTEYDYLSDLSEQDENEIRGAIRTALNKREEFPIIPFREEYNRGNVYIAPIVADARGIKNGDTIRLKVDNAYSIVREAKVVDIEGRNFAGLFGIKVYAEDLQQLLYSEKLPTDMIEVKYTLEKVGKPSVESEFKINQAALDKVPF